MIPSDTLLQEDDNSIKNDKDFELSFQFVD